MRRAFFGALMLLAGVAPPPQGVGAPDITGTWIFVAPLKIRNVTGVGRRIRGFTEDGWYVAQLALDSDEVWFVYGGHYTLVDGVETETVEYATPNFSSFVHRRFTYDVKVEGTTLTLSAKGNGGEAANGTEDGVWQKGLSRLVGRSVAPSRESTQAVLEGVELVQETLDAPPERLAAAYLGNHYRLDLLAALKGDDRAALYFGGVQVTPSNAAQFRAAYQHREDVYVAEMRRRGVPRVAGRYRLEVVQPCGQPEQARTVTLTQDGIAVDVRDPSDAAYRLSGATTAGMLTVGRGEFNPDTYSYGTITRSGHIELTAFSGAGCRLTLTRLQVP